MDNAIIRPSLNSFAATYELAEDPQVYEDLMTATSNLTGKKINRFTHLHQSTDDLIKKVKMQRLLGQKTAACFQRCVGMDASNAVYSTTYETDEACGTHYFDNFVKFWTDVQENDWAVDGAMTDVKGDRSLSPSKQADPDPVPACGGAHGGRRLRHGRESAPDRLHINSSLCAGDADDLDARGGRGLRDLVRLSRRTRKALR